MAFLEFVSKYYCKCSLFTVVFGLFLSHSYFILHYYFKYETFEESRSELHWPIELPEVTVCGNDVVFNVVAGTQSKYKKKNEMEYVRILSFAKERYFSTTTDQTSDLINTCEYTDFNVGCKKYKHFNYYYGECETLNVVDGKDLDTPITGIKIVGNAKRTFTGYQFQRQPSFVMLVHQPETPPILFRENLIFGDLTGDYVIHLKKKIINRIDCFEKENVLDRKIPSIKNGTKYSYETCLSSCYQNFTFSQCGCILPQFYFAENAYRYPVCRMCRGDFTFDLSQMCDCKPSCKDVQWEWSVEDVTYINEIEPLRFQFRPFSIYGDKHTQLNGDPEVEEKKKYDYEFRLALEEELVEDESYYYFRAQPKRDSVSEHKFRIKVQFETAEVTVVDEKLLMEKVHLVGTIGGSICLCFATYFVRALQLIVVEILHFYGEIKRKFNLINRAKVDFNLRRVLVVLKQLLWLLPTVALTFLFGLLSKDLIDDYLNFSTLQHPSIDWRQNFPAVTVCSGVPVFWNQYNNQSEFIRQLVTDMEKENIRNAWEQWNPKNYTYYEALHRKLQTRSQKEREENGLKLDEYIKKCTWSNSGLRYNCSEAQFVQFNNRKYGNCATFNHGSLTNEDRNGPIDDVEMMLSFNQLPVPVGRNGLPGLMVYLHERGTAPLFTPSTTHLIRAFSFNHITFTSEKHRFSSRNCVDGADAEMREKSVYQDEHRQYLHTMKSCLESCIQKLIHEEIRCRSCYQPLMFGKYEASEENICTTFCPWIEEEFLADKCNCKQNCYSIEYKTQISGSTFNKAAKNQFKTYEVLGKIDYTICAHSGSDAYYHAHFIRRTIFPDGNCGFKISAQKDVQKVTYETLKMKLANVLGLVGGIMGFLQALLSIFRSLRIFITQSP